MFSFHDNFLSRKSSLLFQAISSCISKLNLQNTCLRGCNLSCNYIGTAGAEVIASGLKKNKTLRLMSFTSNSKIGYRGAQAILNGGLDYLNLADCGLSEAEKKSITEEAKKCTPELKVSFSGDVSMFNVIANEEGDRKLF